MACCGKGKRQDPGEPIAKISTKQVVKVQPPVVDLSGDVHCPECGLVRSRRQKNYGHTCPGSKGLLLYQQQRRVQCDQCEHARHGICLEYKKIHHDRACLIKTGVKIPFAKCPIGKWPAVQRDCNSCGRRTVDLNGVSACRFCGKKFFQE